ncbi:Hypothetical protein PFCIRM119_01380 [Propionibacterium freudenreichii]|uniref:Uncharacterized protein n=2 Tax=Propionibacterium freudenreichii TaxID=1744 RepID=D7GEM8_PROFC|nr:Hypothetical protein PFREUD_14900 [Propionibacterium freudenreichii subsp. shermanii CIRM-BIA1]CDP49304.1 Hypothetical protein PFCIRM129_11185 [Propionibacterium freudenreichii subsp. freudenreichii]CEG85943.1 Hypothetical protein PFCIRM118_03855 [Propionibacterium freudenreichii]CEG90421.1 Hypothetical protein PFCIRM119_01380 [Propionibacterium freudenreichii]CEG91917.1 Hypothetical protein PFCIRM121_01545 [Propionibacterium freudenreichii]
MDTVYALARKKHGHRLRAGA